MTAPSKRKPRKRLADQILCVNIAGHVVLEAHVDPKHNDIVVGGFGVSPLVAVMVRNWFDDAIKKVRKK